MAGMLQKKEAGSALGHSRGGFRTQIHILADRTGRPLRLRVTAACATIAPSRALVESWTDAPRPCQIADRAYDGDAFRAC